jgi:hypothetical protein
MEGVSLSYKKHGLWKTIFPFGEEADCHRVTLKEGSAGTEIALARHHNRITVTTPDTGGTEAREGEGFENFLDLTVVGDSHDSIELKSAWEQNCVFMTLENAELMEHEPTLCRYQLREKGGGITRRPRRIAYSGRAEIVADTIKIEIPGLQGYDPLTLTPESEDMILTIDNECDDKPTSQTGDLDLLYMFIVRDAAATQRQFAVERDPRDEPLPRYRDKVRIVNNNPAAFERGLPCNKFVASNVEGLE